MRKNRFHSQGSFSACFYSRVVELLLSFCTDLAISQTTRQKTKAALRSILASRQTITCRSTTINNHLCSELVILVVCILFAEKPDCPSRFTRGLARLQKCTLLLLQPHGTVFEKSKRLLLAAAAKYLVGARSRINKDKITQPRERKRAD